MAKIEATSVADRDLAQVLEYVAAHDALAAVKLLETFERKAEIYASNPLLGESTDGLGPDIRSFRFARYVVVFRKIPDGIRLLRILHASRELPRNYLTEE